MAPARIKQGQAAINKSPTTQITTQTARRAFPLNNILVYNTPVTINYYHHRLAHLTKPRRCVADGKVGIYRIGLPAEGHRLAGLSVDRHFDVTVNLMYPCYDRYAERAWTEPVPCDRGVRMNYVWVPMRPREEFLEASGTAQDRKESATPRRVGKEEGCGCNIL